MTDILDDLREWLRVPSHDTTAVHAAYDELERIRKLNAELLAALEGVMRFALPITFRDADDFKRARKAIAAAEGKK